MVICFSLVISLMVPGNKLNEVYQKSQNFLKEKHPYMLEFFG